MVSGTFTDFDSPPNTDGNDVFHQAGRRRTFAIIAHPDAGKSTLTEALALHARVITEAGVTHGKQGRQASMSDWGTMERERGISISSTALRFEHGDVIFNLLDTPGHADFSEDTYRVLTAVDCAIMLVDSARGMETQTLKLFAVCKELGLPVVTVFNKWDRPGQETLQLLDEVQDATGRMPVPLNWPVGIAGDFRGLYNPESGTYSRLSRTNAGASLAQADELSPEEAALDAGDAWEAAREDCDMAVALNGSFDGEDFLAGRTTPVLFAAAASNFGVAPLLDFLVDRAPAPGPRADSSGTLRPLDSEFSGFVFKMQSGMNPNHHDKLAFVRVCSGTFRRGMALRNDATAKPVSSKYAHHMSGRDRDSADVSWPGDVVGFSNASGLRIGDTVHAGETVSFPRLPHFNAEHFRVVRSLDAGRSKAFARGISHLEEEGTIQVLYRSSGTSQSPIFAAVGVLQFDVALDRLKREFNAPAVIEEALPYEMARDLYGPEPVQTAKAAAVEVVYRSNGNPVGLFRNQWKLGRTMADSPELFGITGDEAK